MNDKTSHDLVLRNGRLIDGTGTAPVQGATVHVADGRIAWTGPESDAPRPPAGAAVIDAQGARCCPASSTVTCISPHPEAR